MTQSKLAKQIHPVPLGKLLLIGAGIGLILISLFLLNAGEPDPTWGKYWMVRPLVSVPLAGAAGGVFYYLMDGLRYWRGSRKILANVLSLLVFLLALWLGTVLGLAGTMWH
jgi:hypothetical protein